MSITQEFRERLAHDWHITEQGVRVRIEEEVFLIPWADGEIFSDYLKKREKING